MPKIKYAVLQRQAYRGFNVYYDPPPIPDRRWDWIYAHEDFDGAPDSKDRRSGAAASLDACKAEIDDWYAEQNDHAAMKAVEGICPSLSLSSNAKPLKETT